MGKTARNVGHDLRAADKHRQQHSREEANLNQVSIAIHLVKPFLMKK